MRPPPIPPAMYPPPRPPRRAPAPVELEVLRGRCRSSAFVSVLFAIVTMWLLAIPFMAPGCAAVEPIAMTALEAVAPAAAEALAKAVVESFGADHEPDKPGCYEFEEGFGDDEYVFVLCRAKGKRVEQPDESE